MHTMKKIFGILLLMVLVGSCEPEVLFDQPQPPKSVNLKNIPQRLRGTYLSKKDSGLLIITERTIYWTSNLKHKMPASKIDSGYVLQGDSLVNMATHEKLPVKRMGDSILVEQKNSDTLFRMSTKNILRKFRGYYFLNKAYKKEWEVDKLSLSKGILTIGSISTSEDLSKLNEIKETGADTASHHLAPTRMQFRKFVKNNGFKETVEFEKVR